MSDGLPTHCTCPADQKYNGACKHRLAVAIRDPVLDAAIHTQLAADGSGTSQRAPAEEDPQLAHEPQQPTPSPDDESTSNSAEWDDEEFPCECDGLTDDFPCWNCVLANRRALPDR
ncbi:SWIM zinc finger family protein [Halorarum halobium]|uniref:SWIM zinc finger family protein n=1 Tax=Halorarum halobium TaxID=3075121 RepID=UPI0028A651CA|nr:SWIM zinc finger family protein [Halobaculum sp. XH14]